MNMINKFLLLLSIILLPYSAFSGKDPIKWVLTQSIPSIVIASGGSYVASYTFTNEVPLDMVKPLTILKTSNSASEFSYSDSCTGKKLKQFESCQVKIYLNPNSSGLKTVFLTEYYGNNQVPLPKLVATATDSGGNSGINGVVTTALPQTLAISASAPWSFTFTNNGTTPATGVNIAVSGSSYSTTCGLNLSPGSSCVVQGSYTANSSGVHSVLATFSYAQGAPVQVSTATTGDGQSSGLVCTAAVPLAPQTLVSTTTTVTLLCTNKTGSPIAITGHTSIYPTGGAGTNGAFTPSIGGDNCTNQTLNNNASCQLSGTYMSPSAAINPVSISLLVNYNAATTGLVSQTSTTTEVVSTITNTRTIHLVNQCGFDVWWSMVGGAITNSPACTSNNDCPTGSTCNVSAKLCYYNNYGPTTGSYQLAMTNGVADTQIIQTPASTLSDQVLWKGLISASTQCLGTSCQNNDCQSNGGTTSCAPGVGFGQPATEAEFTFLLVGAGNVDTYDISNVNGFSLPISMSTNQSASNYTCGTAGNNLAAGNLGACDFSQVTPPTNMYYWVSNTGVACTSQNTCSDNTKICGLAFNTVANNYTKNCGAFLGYWAANEICQTNPAFSSPFGDSFSCNQYLSNPFPENTYTLTQLLKCSPPVSSAPLFNSCYLNYSGGQLTQCCGCTDWAGIANPSASCPAGQSDPQWTSYVEPLIRWMKQACPTSYSYPFDDKASTFQCAASAATEYTITFCPGGGSGLPGGKTDGRG